MGATTNGEQKCSIAAYLWYRIRSLGVGSVMGVPGDMNLELLDYIDHIEGLEWVGNCNELNSAYAADGYCRVKGTPGVFVTTMGVGELSALNGVAGAYTEHVKVIHIVGTTATKVQAKRAMIHHCLGPNPDHRVYEKISEHVRATHCWLDDSDTAANEIDRVIKICYLESLPVYIFVPMDFVHKQIPSAALETPLDLQPRSDGDACKAALEATWSQLHTARSPVVIVDALTARFGAGSIAGKFLDCLRIPAFTTPMGKSIIDETKPYFHGVYSGAVTCPGMADAVEKSDLVLDIGPILSDSNTGGHSRKINPSNYISINPQHVEAGTRSYENVYIVDFLTQLLERFQSSPLSSVPMLKLPPRPTPEDAQAKHITQSWIWERIGRMCRPGDILIGESGTAQFGLSDAVFDSNVQYLTQIYYGSIGYATPACFGAALAQQELGKGGRTILVTGDGSLQLTVQEIGTMVKLGMDNIILIVINNEGYTIERAIHGPAQAYNDIAKWNHQMLLSAFGMKDGQKHSRYVSTKAEFDDIVSSSDYIELKSIQLLEVMMGKMDVPWRLQEQINLIKSRNAAAQKEGIQSPAS